MIKINEQYRPRGWQALKILLQRKGLKGTDLEEAESSFYQGMTVLSNLFLSNSPTIDIENKKNNRMKKVV